MRISQLLGALTGIAVATAGPVQAQMGQPRTTARDTLVGVVVAIDTMRMSMSHQHDSGTAMKHEMHQSMMGQSMSPSGGLVVKLGRATDTVEVHLGPVWYLKQQNPDGFAIGDRLTVISSRMEHDGKAHAMAYSVTKGDLEIVLFDDQGRPRWAQAMMQQHRGNHPKPPR